MTDDINGRHLEGEASMGVDPTVGRDGVAAPGGAGAEQSGACACDGNTRRNVLAGAGLVGLAGLAAACGGSDAATGSAGSDGSAAGAGAGAALAKTSDIPVGGGKVFKDQKVVVTQPAQGEFKAFSSVCTHAGCDVGSVSGGTINCPCHGSKFKIADASPAGGPATKPLEAKTIKVDGDSITLA